MKSKWFWLIAALAATGVYRSLVFVDEAEMVIVTQFGDPVRSHSLSDVRFARDFPWVQVETRPVEPGKPGPSGLRFKLPYQSVIRLDRRLQIYDPRPSEFLAAEKKNVDLDVFVCWRVDAREPLVFLQTVGDFPGAEARIHDVVFSELAAEVGSNPLEALVSTDPEVHRLDELVGTVAARCDERTRRAYGLEIVDMRLKRIALPAQVRDSVFDRMRSERARIAGQYRAEGEEQATAIRAEADKERKMTLAAAYAQSEKIRGQAEAEATRTYAEAHQQDPGFYELMRSLEAYRKFLDEKTTVLLSADSDLLKYLTRIPASGEADGSNPAE